MDSDKWVSPTTLGEVTQYLKDIKTLPTKDEKVSLNFFLAPPKLVSILLKVFLFLLSSIIEYKNVL